MSCTEKFPNHLINLIKTSKYVHLATASTDCVPSVSLMNYTYIPADKTFRSSPDQKDCFIIFATFNNTEKYINILSNPTVSLLFHDWVTANNLSVKKNSLSRSGTPMQEKESTPSATASAPQHPSKLLNLLQQLNQAELNEMSATIRGEAMPIDPGSEESLYYKDILLKTNPDAKVFIDSDKTVIVKVKIESAKVTDNENNTNIYK
ncbi:similar to Saccharomyces cerevisiae YPR172W Protein of unknown function, transcriptionally activated by Yrm1p along with genes involved in multidrug resistance [Maudiozyma barnettii]|uniref:Pyridoxamine 5'-phosphate oxidase N-terminal domain-containing protein n=1 Tax=Maudiozyma barnettii TaxID=61262 RepID=A0A8H2VE68_9SACH|nr:pyridoxal 5'-phosphate synthase [Kazachstania barnettii]CAB4253920.1 similar to Saccharomyces cerevisiae YPR172W Protein of unknown function, transcriptionally activated by Yrm1p along with genes involved in multidrug resistance [Kazachstania barnettii]CAD1781670.1 similar to Saccharomyces cerevisiae YPR172W Protein of unknown function, transcriptionally activated by Yrm1p along with genes involved in multidrug resistance [Kazachstania barnettii]